MISLINGCILHGVETRRVGVEVSVSRGLGYHLTGLAGNSIREALSRIAIAVAHSGYRMPRTKLVINLTPADIRKTGTALDLPIALGILAATDQLTLPENISDFQIAGELGLDGSIYPVRGALCMAACAAGLAFTSIIIPKANGPEAAPVKNIRIYTAGHLKEVVYCLAHNSPVKLTVARPAPATTANDNVPDFKDIKGQPAMKRAMEIIAAGGHHALLIGHPGTAKTMCAKRLPSILPPMTPDESLDTTRIYSVLSASNGHMVLISQRPFRSPHHSCSEVALAGGGLDCHPGEISKAHNGILFLDELPEFKRSAIEILRQPLEDQKIHIARAGKSLTYPASFILVASMNPCPCGFFGHPSGRCRCSNKAINAYRHKISGPLLDRIDLQIVSDPAPPPWTNSTPSKEESSAEIRQRVLHARKLQDERFAFLSENLCNARLPEQYLHRYCLLDRYAYRHLASAIERFQWSARVSDKLLRVARTIADLADNKNIELEHIAEAVHMRAAGLWPWAQKK